MALRNQMCLSNENRTFKALLLICLGLALAFGCAQGRKAQAPDPFPENPGKVVVMGFRSALEKGTSPEVIRSPISGNAFTAQPVPEDKIHLMTERLFRRLSDSGRYDLVSPDQARGVYASLVSSSSMLSEIDIIQRMGSAFAADSVLAGYLYRWREREGQDYAVRNAASVAFDLYLIRPDNGAVLWKGHFDVTQKSLSENLLEVDTFLHGGGKWMTADQLADMGLDRLLGDLPASSNRGGED